ncbi:MAG TPA: folate-binding protein [Burkholderiales bacterium]
MDTRVSHSAAELPQYGMLSCTGDEARAFLHAQLTSDIVSLGADGARRAGWCSAKGRLLATFLVIPQDDGFLLQLSRDLAQPVAKRLAMFILRAKVKLADASSDWAQIGFWGASAAERLGALGLHAPVADLAVTRGANGIAVRLGAQRYLAVVRAARREAGLAAQADAAAGNWALEEIRAGQPMVVLATQDLFVPQMVNLERLGAVDFKKGCYPGQEIVARTQYRGVLKRRMVRARVSAAAVPALDVFAEDAPGQASGTVVNAAPTPEGGHELLAVVQISSLEAASVLRLGAPDGPRLELLPLPSAA